MPFPVKALGLFLLLGISTGCNEHERLKMKAQMGNRRAMYEYGLNLWKYGTTIKQDEGLAWMTKAAEKGEVDAMYDVGGIFSQGGGAHPKGVYWLRKGAEAGDRRCMIELAGAYRFGLMGVVRHVLIRAGIIQNQRMRFFQASEMRSNFFTFTQPSRWRTHP